MLLSSGCLFLLPVADASRIWSLPQARGAACSSPVTVDCPAPGSAALRCEGDSEALRSRYSNLGQRQSPQLLRPRIVSNQDLTAWFHRPCPYPLPAEPRTTRQRATKPYAITTDTGWHSQETYRIDATRLEAAPLLLPYSNRALSVSAAYPRHEVLDHGAAVRLPRGAR